MRSDSDHSPILVTDPAFLISKVYFRSIKNYLQKTNKLQEEPDADLLPQMMQNSEGLRIERVSESLLLTDSCKTEVLTNVNCVIHKRKAKLFSKPKATSNEKIAARLSDFKRSLIRLNSHKKQKKKYSLTITPIN